MDETVYQWAGPPRIALTRRRVEHNGESWLQHALHTNDRLPGVIVVATAGGRALVVNHWRPAVGKTLVEFPRGFADPIDFHGRSEGEGVIRAAERELAEETGYELVKPRIAGLFYPDSGIMASHVYVVSGGLAGDPVIGPEVDGVRHLETADLRNRVLDGSLGCGLTVTAAAIAGLLS